jgi:hypothetical protein
MPPKAVLQPLFRSKSADDLGQLPLGMQAPVEALGIVDLAIGVDPAVGRAQLDRHGDLAGEVLLVIGPEGGGDLALGVGQEPSLVARRLGDEVQHAADLARAIDRGRRAAHDLDLGRPADRRGIGAAVLDPLEAAEIVLGQGAADVERARHAVEAGGVGSRRDGGQAVDGLDAVALSGWCR